MFVLCPNQFFGPSKTHELQLKSDYFDIGNVTQHLTLHRQSCKKDSYGAKKVQVLGPIIWNDLPGELRDAPSLQIFKKSLISLLLSNYSVNQ